MEKLNFAEYSTSKEAIHYYFRGVCIVSIGIFTSAITYPIAVRIAKNVLKLKNVLNIHMVTN